MSKVYENNFHCFYIHIIKASIYFYFHILSFQNNFKKFWKNYQFRESSTIEK